MMWEKGKKQEGKVYGNLIPDLELTLEVVKVEQMLSQVKEMAPLMPSHPKIPIQRAKENLTPHILIKTDKLNSLAKLQQIV